MTDPSGHVPAVAPPLAVLTGCGGGGRGEREASTPPTIPCLTPGATTTPFAYSTAATEVRNDAVASSMQQDAVDSRIWSGSRFRAADEVSIAIGYAGQRLGTRSLHIPVSRGPWRRGDDS